MAFRTENGIPTVFWKARCIAATMLADMIWPNVLFVTCVFTVQKRWPPHGGEMGRRIIRPQRTLSVWI